VGFVANFAFQQCKNFENRLQSYREFKGGNFLRHSVVLTPVDVQHAK